MIHIWCRINVAITAASLSFRYWFWGFSFFGACLKVLLVRAQLPFSTDAFAQFLFQEPFDHLLWNPRILEDAGKKHE
jgi:hypothetical protein